MRPVIAMSSEIPEAATPASSRERGLSAQALRRHWWVVVLVLAATLCSVAVLTSREPTVYRATTTLIVAPISAIQGEGDVLRSLDTLERRSVIATFAKIPSTPETRDAAAQSLGLAPAALAAYRIAASVLPNTNIIKLDVDGPDPRRAADVANAAALHTKDVARSLYRVFTMRPLAQAVPVTRPVYPDPQRNYTVGAVLGLLLGALAAVALHQVRATAG